MEQIEMVKKKLEIGTEETETEETKTEETEKKETELEKTEAEDKENKNTSVKRKNRRPFEQRTEQILKEVLVNKRVGRAKSEVFEQIKVSDKQSEEQARDLEKMKQDNLAKELGKKFESYYNKLKENQKLQKTDTANLQKIGEYENTRKDSSEEFNNNLVQINTKNGAKMESKVNKNPKFAKFEWKASLLSPSNKKFQFLSNAEQILSTKEILENPFPTLQETDTDSEETRKQRRINMFKKSEDSLKWKNAIMKQKNEDNVEMHEENIQANKTIKEKLQQKEQKVLRKKQKQIKREISEISKIFHRATSKKQILKLQKKKYTSYNLDMKIAQKTQKKLEQLIIELREYKYHMLVGKYPLECENLQLVTPKTKTTKILELAKMIRTREMEYMDVIIEFRYKVDQLQVLIQKCGNMYDKIIKQVNKYDQYKSVHKILRSKMKTLKSKIASNDKRENANLWTTMIEKERRIHTEMVAAIKQLIKLQETSNRTETINLTLQNDASHKETPKIVIPEEQQQLETKDEPNLTYFLQQNNLANAVADSNDNNTSISKNDNKALASTTGLTTPKIAHGKSDKAMESKHEERNKDSGEESQQDLKEELKKEIARKSRYEKIKKILEEFDEKKQAFVKEQIKTEARETDYNEIETERQDKSNFASYNLHVPLYSNIPKDYDTVKEVMKNYDDAISSRWLNYLELFDYPIVRINSNKICKSQQCENQMDTKKVDVGKDIHHYCNIAYQIATEAHKPENKII